MAVRDVPATAIQTPGLTALSDLTMILQAAETPAAAIAAAASSISRALGGVPVSGFVTTSGKAVVAENLLPAKARGTLSYDRFGKTTWPKLPAVKKLAGELGAQPHILPLRYQSEQMGALVVWAEGLTPTIRSCLAILANTTAATLKIQLLELTAQEHAAKNQNLQKISGEKEKLQAIQNGIADGLVLIDTAGAIVDCNQEWSQLFGLTGRLTNQPFLKQLTSSKQFTTDREPDQILRDTLRGKHHTYYVQDLVHNRHIQISVNPITAGGRFDGAVATARDITPLIEKTVEANEMAAKAQRHLRELTQLAELTGIAGFNVDSIYQKYLSKTATLLESPAVSLYLYNPTKQQLIRSQVHGPESDTPATLALTSKHLVARAFASRQPATTGGGGMGAHRIAIPIIHHSKTLGVLLVGRSGASYGDHEARLLRMVATRLAVLVENAALYHDVNARRERWEAVFRFTEEGIVIFDRAG
ncbi:MAG TPA: GAF domain-containing protein, partial [Candidatus Saccharimonadia bacterium]|nr:GAF domain-containing protein [Candidatus Saccharimonadia bacterium]